MRDKAKNTFSANYPLYFFSQSLHYLISEPFSLAFYSIHVQGTFFKSKIMGSFIKAILASETQERIPASELLHHSEVTIFLPFAIETVCTSCHQTLFNCSAQKKSYRMSWQKRWIFTHDESLELTKKYKASETELNFPTFWGSVVQARLRVCVKAETHKDLLISYPYLGLTLHAGVWVPDWCVPYIP